MSILLSLLWAAGIGALAYAAHGPERQPMMRGFCGVGGAVLVAVAVTLHLMKLTGGD